MRTAGRVVRWLRSRVRGGPLILGYHRIASPEWDPQGLSVSAENFAAQLGVLRSKVNVVSLAQILSHAKADTSKDRCVAITFDDGYADNQSVALPILEEFALPATVFVSTGFIGRSFWWYDLQHLIERSSGLPSEISLRVADATLSWRAGANKRRNPKRLLALLCDFFRALPVEAHEQALAELSTFFDAATQTEAEDRALTAEELWALGASPLVDIGSHTVNHVSLDRASDAVQRYELEASKRTLESLLEQPVRSFSFPNGRISPVTGSIAAELGYACGCSSREDVVIGKTDPFALPRFWVGNWGPGRFSRWLDRWLQ